MRSRIIVFIMACIVVVAPAATSGGATLQQLNSDMIALVKLTAPSVVEIRAMKRSMAGSIKTPPRASVGTGFVLDEKGHILTTAGVVANADSIRVHFTDDTDAAAKLVGIDPITETAVIKVNKTELVPVVLGNSSEAELGSLVITVNNQAGLMNSVSLGMVSGIGRLVGGNGLDLIQISGMTGPGASGGPVFDTTGKVIGVTTAMLAPFPTAMPFASMAPNALSMPSAMVLQKELDSLTKSLGPNHMDVLDKKAELELARVRESQDPTETAARLQQILTAANAAEIFQMSGNCSFAIPVDRIKPVLPVLVSGQSLHRPWMGLSLTLKGGDIILSPSPGSPAEKAGIEAGDVLKMLDNVPVVSVPALINHFMSKRPGDTITLVVKRGERELTTRVLIGSHPAEATSADRTIISIKRTTVPGALVTIDLENVSMDEAAGAISSAFAIRVTAAENLRSRERITYTIRADSVEGALSAFCEAINCQYSKEGNTYIIGSK